MASVASFSVLSRNKIEGREYIGTSGLERHYDTHVAIANAAFPGTRFDEVAAVTELFLCATSSGAGLPFESSPCASRYLDRTIAEVQPTVIVTMGKLVFSYFQSVYGAGMDVSVIAASGRSVTVIPVAHPNARFRHGGATGTNEIRWAGQCIRAVVAGDPPPPRPLASGRGAQIFGLTPEARLKEPRFGSVKAGIVANLRELGDAFVEQELRDAIAAAMKYDPKTRSFGVTTRFKTIEAAASAWRGQLRKEGFIVHLTP
jgi:hypothetical protein